MRLDALATILLVGVTLAVILAAACGADEEAAEPEAPQAAAVPADPAAPVAPSGAPGAPRAAMAAPTAMMMAPTPAPAETAFSSGGDGAAGSGTDGNGASDASGDELATLAQDRRIVVRTMDMGLVVANIQGAMDRIASVAANMGGWTVSSERSDDFSGKVAVRVPADRLDEAVAQVRGAATEVEWEISTSEDVTAEYYDSQSRIRNLRATETAMLNLLERAPDAEDALAIRNSLTEVQEDLEVLLGRIKLLEETSAFSLINVTMRVQRIDLNVDAGPDRTVSIGQTVRFKATFRAPDDSSTYRVEWDFGDRSRPTGDSFTAPTTEQSTRVTAAVTHVFADYRDSPYFVDVRIWGGSDTSPLFGQDTIKVTVIDTDQMPVDAGEDQTAAVGRNVRFRAFFEPPEGIDQFTYTWDFGDGSPQAHNNRVILTEDSSRMVTGVTNHVYGSAAESPYIVQIKMVGTGEAGVVEGSDKIVVTVTEVPVLLVSAGENVTVEAGATARFRGTFTRPAGVANLRYRWDFGDGSAVEEGDLDEENRVETEHKYVHVRREPYAATLTVVGDSEAGAVEASSSVQVTVVEGRGWVVGGYNIEGNTKDAVRVLTTVVKGFVTVAIWVAVLSPIWGGVIAVVFGLNRLSKYWRSRTRPNWPIRPRGPRPGLGRAESDAGTAPEAEDDAECSSCGTKNREGVRFCTGCGDAMDAEPSS